MTDKFQKTGLKIPQEENNNFKTQGRVIIPRGRGIRAIIQGKLPTDRNYG